MAEYIELSAAIEAAKHAWAKGLDPSQYIESLPAADVVPVVRCTDCDGSQVSDDGKYIVCCRLGVRTGFWDFCSRGAKMEGGK